MDEHVGRQLEADQWELLEQQAEMDHPAHEDTDADHCPICTEMGADDDDVGPVIFSHEIARSQLRNEGEVITFRTDDRTTGDTWWRESRTGEKQGDVRITKIKAVCPHGTGQALEPFVAYSGFDSVHEWQQAIRGLNDGTMPREGWLFRVRGRETGDAV